MTAEELKKLIAAGETLTVEFKETTGQRGEACKTLCAFLNGRGGTVVFGVTRKGKLTGQLMADTTKRDLFEAFQKFEPSADIEVEYVPVDESHVAIVCRVERGNGRPYAYDATPYKRVQSSTTVMSQEEYERMLSERGGFRSDWERQENPRLTIDEIDLEEVKKTARMAVQVGRLDPDVDTDDAVMLLKKFKLMRGDRLLNAAAVLFGNDAMIDYPQCEIKMVKNSGQEKAGQKCGKIGQKREAKVSQKAGKVSQKSAAKVSQKNGKVSQKSVRSDMRLTEIRRRAACSIDVVLPSLRRDVRKNVENALVAIGVNAYVTIREISKKIHVSVATVKNAESLLKEVGILYRVGGDRGGHWLVSWKGGK